MMLGPNKWRLLTIVAGILLAHAIDSPNRSAPRINQPSQQRSSYPSASPISTHLGLTVEKVVPIWNNSKRSFSQKQLARNLYTPFKRFSNIDDVRYIERHQTGYRNNMHDGHTIFGAYRYATPSQLNERSSMRRSDIDASLFTHDFVNGTPSNQHFDEDIVTTLKPTTLQLIKRHKYRYIPLSGTAGKSIDNLDIAIESTTLPDQEIRSRTDLNLYPDENRQHQNGHVDIENDDSLTTGTETDEEEQEENQDEPLAEQSEQMPQALALRSAYQSHLSNKFTFSTVNPAYRITDETQTQSNDDNDIRGRRSGMIFPQQRPKYDPPFIPQSYQEDDPNHPNFQSPYSEELSPAEPTEIRTARGAQFESYPHRSSVVQFPGPSSNHNTKPYRDDVTKFGDVNGPITSLQQRQFSDYFEGIRTYDNIYYSDDYRRPRHYYPAASKSPFYDFNNEYANQPLRSRLIVPYKSSRTPRVIFPSNDNSPNGIYNGENYNSNDNVVFR